MGSCGQGKGSRRAVGLYLAGLGRPQAMRQLDNPLQPLHQLLKGSGEVR